MWLTRVAEDQDEISWCLHTILKPSMSFIVESWIYFSKDKAFCPSSLEDKLPTGFSGYFILAVGKYRKFFIFLLTLNCFLFLSHLKVSPGLLELAQFIKKKNYGYMKRNTAAMGGEKKKVSSNWCCCFPYVGRSSEESMRSDTDALPRTYRSSFHLYTDKLELKWLHNLL